MQSVFLHNLVYSKQYTYSRKKCIFMAQTFHIPAVTPHCSMLLTANQPPSLFYFPKHRFPFWLNSPNCTQNCQTPQHGRLASSQTGPGPHSDPPTGSQHLGPGCLRQCSEYVSASHPCLFSAGRVEPLFGMKLKGHCLWGAFLSPNDMVILYPTLLFIWYLILAWLTFSN